MFGLYLPDIGDEWDCRLDHITTLGFYSSYFYVKTAAVTSSN
jgi:hypothetical protein